MMYGQQQQQVHQFQKQTKMDPHHVSRTVGGVGDNRTKPTEEGEERRMRRRLDDVIDLSGMSLDSLPNTRINLAAITELDLSNNDLQLIPESLMARLLNLIVLDVHSNQLKCLPNSIGCLSKLKLLNVSGNLLEYLPKTIEHCRGFGPVGTTRISSKAVLLFLISSKLEKKLVMESMEDDDTLRASSSFLAATAQ